MNRVSYLSRYYVRIMHICFTLKVVLPAVVCSSKKYAIFERSEILYIAGGRYLNDKY